MKIKAIKNEINDLPEDLRRYAFTQDDKGKLDLTIGLEYFVYGIRELKGNKYFLILTDSIHNELPWWMPSVFFECVDESIPQSWTTIKRGFLRKDKISAAPSYHGNENIIEDSLVGAKDIFKKMIRESQV